MDGAGGEGDAAVNLSLMLTCWDLTSLDGAKEERRPGESGPKVPGEYGKIPFSK